MSLRPRADQPDRRAEVSEFFDASAGWRGGFYRDPSDPFGRMLMRRKEHVLRLLAAHLRPAGARILDAGCGPGEYLGELLAAGAAAVGLDPAGEMLAAADRVRRAAGRGGATGLVRGDVERTPFRTGSFDAALCIGVLGYLREDRRALRELARVLRPGGLLLLNVRNLYALTSLHHTLRLKLRARRESAGAERAGRESMATHTRGSGWTSRAYDIRSLERTVGEEGFERLEALTFGYELKPLTMAGVGGATVARMESMLERIMMAAPVGPLGRAGWGYVGVYRRGDGGKGGGAEGPGIRSASRPR